MNIKVWHALVAVAVAAGGLVNLSNYIVSKNRQAIIDDSGQVLYDTRVEYIKFFGPQVREMVSILGPDMTKLIGFSNSGRQIWQQGFNLGLDPSEVMSLLIDVAERNIDPKNLDPEARTFVEVIRDVMQNHPERIKELKEKIKVMPGFEQHINDPDMKKDWRNYKEYKKNKILELYTTFQEHHQKVRHLAFREHERRMVERERAPAREQAVRRLDHYRPQHRV